MSWKDRLKFIGHKEKLWISPRKASLLSLRGELLFFVLFSFKVEIPFFTARILEILNLCFGEKPINSKADRTAAILFSSSGNKNSNEFFFSCPQFSRFSASAVCSPGCLNPPQSFFYLSKEIGRVKWEKKVFPGWKMRQYFWTREA